MFFLNLFLRSVSSRKLLSIPNSSYFIFFEEFELSYFLFPYVLSTSYKISEFSFLRRFFQSLKEQPIKTILLSHLQVSLSIRSFDTEGMTLTDMERRQTVDTGLFIDFPKGEVAFKEFQNVDPSINYWSLPRQFLGDKITAYGGNLIFTLRYVPGIDNSPLPQFEPLVEIQVS